VQLHALTPVLKEAPVFVMEESTDESAQTIQKDKRTVHASPAADAKTGISSLVDVTSVRTNCQEAEATSGQRTDFPPKANREGGTHTALSSRLLSPAKYPPSLAATPSPNGLILR
jgi:hypothetical protein